MDDEVPVVAVRPFLDRGRATAHATTFTTAHSTDDYVDDDTAQVRAYAMTRGRSQAAVHLAFETMLKATPSGMDPSRHERFERGSILQWCRVEALSVAELAARLRVPIGVVRVVAADLLLEGHLEAFQASEHVADDVLLITRLIAGVRAL